MSDTGRKDLSTRMAESATPDSQKTMGERVKESVTNAGDKVASAVTPSSHKSTTQQAADVQRPSQH